MCMTEILEWKKPAFLKTLYRQKRADMQFRVSFT